MMRVLVCLTVLSLLPALAPAQNESVEALGATEASGGLSSEEVEARRAATRHLLKVLKVDEQFDQTIGQTLLMVDQMIDQDPSLDEAEREKARNMAKAAIETSLERLSWERLGPIIIEIYAEVFTVEEISGMTEFFETPIGQSFIEKQPQLTAATFRRIGKLMQDEMPIIQAEVEAAIEAAAAEPEAASESAE